MADQEVVEHISEAELIASITRDSFIDFVREFWSCIPGIEPLVMNWHLEYLAEELQKIAERVFKGLPKEHDMVINVPPGTSKSTLCSILYPAWIWTRMPNARILSASHTSELCLDLANKSRMVINSDLYKACFPEIELRTDQDAKGYFINTLGGDRLTCTVAGKSPMGFHAHVLIPDDPIDPRKAVSEAELKTAREFFTSVLPSRKVNNEVSVTILVMQRLHREDPTAVMLEIGEKLGPGSVKHVCLPGDDSWPISPPELRGRYINGIMSPKRLSSQVLKNKEISLGSYAYAGQYGQSPTPLGGGMFLETWFNKRVKSAPFKSKRVRYWDRASSTIETGCFTVGVLMAKDDEGSYYVEDVVRGQWEPYQRNQKILATAHRDRLRYARNEPIIYVETEGGSTGIDANRKLASDLAGFVIKFDKPTGSKDVRAEPWSAQLAAGNVYIVDDEQATWDINAYISEHQHFRPEPGKRLGRYKDQVDSSSGAFNLLAGSKSLMGMKTVSLTYDKKTPFKKIVICRESDLGSAIIEGRTLLILIRDPEVKEVMCTERRRTSDSEMEVPRSGDISPTSGMMTVPTAHSQDEGPLSSPLQKLLGSVTLTYADIEPDDYQERWNDPVEPYSKKPEDLILTRELGKKLWSVVAKHRDPDWEVLVIAYNGSLETDKRPLSTAYAIADSLHFPRDASVYAMQAPETSHDGVKAPSQFIYQILRDSRHMVI